MLDVLALDSLDSFYVSWLERLFEDDMVYQMVWEMVKDKAPSPDGFSMSFFQASWDVVKEDAMRIFQKFFS